MPGELEISSFLALARTLPVIDVRSPAEYNHGHIPGSVNIPLFSNEERAKVGTLYKQQGRHEAIIVGLDIAGPKLSSFVQRSKEIAVNNEVLIYCWRGGMRSKSFCWLLNTAGIQASALKRGYKAYRSHVLESFKIPVKLIVLGGETGSGKTEILKFIGLAGEQVIDLEALANHKGSAFGAIGHQPQPTPEQFENNLAQEWNKMDFSRRVWVEDESKSIGRVFLNDTLWMKMKNAPIIRVNIPKAIRIKRLLDEYGKSNREELRSAIVRIEKRLGGQACRKALDALEVNALAIVADIVLKYYDKAYNFNHQKRKFMDIHFLETGGEDPERNAEKVIAFANEKLIELTI